MSALVFMKLGGEEKRMGRKMKTGKNSVLYNRGMEVLWSALALTNPKLPFMVL